MPIVSTELSEAELQQLQAHQKTMGAKSLGETMKAALAAFQPPAAAITPGTTHAATTGQGEIAPTQTSAGHPAPLVTDSATAAPQATAPGGAVSSPTGQPTANPPGVTSTPHPAEQAATPQTESARLAAEAERAAHGEAPAEH